MEKILKTFEEKKAYLDNLYYSVGKQGYDFDVFFMDAKTDIKSKWRKWSDVGFNQKDWKDENFIRDANNRTILGCEVVLDLEEPERLEEIEKLLEDGDYGYRLFSTGSRGYHIHMLFNRALFKHEKEEIIKEFDCDMQKASDRCGIALEFTAHWKTGKVKELLKENHKINNFKTNKVEINEEEIKQVITQCFDKRDLAKKVLEIQPFYYDENRIWHYWDKEQTCWKMIDDTDILNTIGTISQQNTINSKEKGEIMEALRQESRKNKPKDMGKMWIQFKDEIFDLQTGEKFKATPEYFAVNPIPYHLNSENFEATPTMDAIFEQWVGKEYVKTMYEILAYCMLADYPIHRLFCLIGEGLNGKSCFLNLLKKFIGTDNCSSTELDLLLSSRFEASRKLYKKSVCIMGETNFTELAKTSILKKATGQDMMGFEYKNKTPFDDVNYAKILIATNNLPETIDKTIGFYRRWMIIDFPNKFNEKVDILATIPDEEYECLALKCCGILKDLLIKREFHNEGSVEERMKRYEQKSDFLQRFLDENVTEHFDSHITKKDFKRKFDDWCYEQKHRKMAENTMGRKMKAKGYENRQVQADWMNDGKGGLMRVWDSIRWINGDNDGTTEERQKSL